MEITGLVWFPSSYRSTLLDTPLGNVIKYLGLSVRRNDDKICFYCAVCIMKKLRSRTSEAAFLFLTQTLVDNDGILAVGRNAVLYSRSGTEHIVSHLCDCVTFCLTQN